MSNFVDHCSKEVQEWEQWAGVEAMVIKDEDIEYSMDDGLPLSLNDWRRVKKILRKMNRMISENKWAGRQKPRRRPGPERKTSVQRRSSSQW